ncbi:MAG: serine O-acetyltransferase, partial [Candidatus Thorarchaeota archaeon]
MFEKIKADYLRYSEKQGNMFRDVLKAVSNAGFRAVLLYRMGRWFRERRLGLAGAITERVMHHLCHCWISTYADIGAGFLIAHVGGLVVGGKTRIGNNCDVRQNVTFGGNFSKKDAEGRTQPWVGDNVSVGAGAVVIGPVT